MSYCYHRPKCNLGLIKIEIERSDWAENFVICKMRIEIAAWSGPKLKWALGWGRVYDREVGQSLNKPSVEVDRIWAFTRGPLLEAGSVVFTDQRRGVLMWNWKLIFDCKVGGMRSAKIGALIFTRNHDLSLAVQFLYVSFWPTMSNNVLSTTTINNGDSIWHDKRKQALQWNFLSRKGDIC